MSIHALNLAMVAKLPTPAHKLALISLADDCCDDGWQTMEGRLDAPRLAQRVGVSLKRIDALMADLCATQAVSVGDVGGEPRYWIDVVHLAALAPVGAVD